MIPVENPIPEPKDFDKYCRKRGNNWLIKNATKDRPHPYWGKFNADLRSGFKNRCAYQGVFITSGTVDHFRSWKDNKSLAYEWSNFRYVEGWLNSSKGSMPVDELVDPFENCEGWFEIILPSLQMVVSEEVPAEHAKRAENTLKKLKLMDDERVISTRRAFMKMYEQNKLSLEGLDDWFPLLAKAIRKRDAQAG